MKNILFVFVTMPIGGAEMLCLNILKRLDRTRFHPLVCCIAGMGPIGEEIKRLGYDIVALNRMRTKRFEPGTVAAIARLIEARQIDIIHTNMYHANLYGRLAALVSGARRPRMVTAIHSLYTVRKFHRIQINRLLNGHTDCILAVSEAVKDELVRYERAPADKIRVLPPGTDIERFDIALSKVEAKRRLGFAESDFLIGTVGRLVEDKGHVYLLQALSMLKNRGFALKAVIAGGGRLEEDLAREAVALGLDGMVQLLGPRNDIPEICRAIDLYVMPSIAEGAPVALLEAMSEGLPCIVSSVGGMVEMVEGGACSLLVPPADPAALAEAILDLHGSPERMGALGRAAKARVHDCYSSTAMVSRLETLYDELLEHKKGR